MWISKLRPCEVLSSCILIKNLHLLMLQTRWQIFENLGTLSILEDVAVRR